MMAHFIDKAAFHGYLAIAGAPGAGRRFWEIVLCTMWLRTLSFLCSGWDETSGECDTRFSHKNSNNSAKHSKSRGEGRADFAI
jgi:hypothetical protein